MKRVIRDFLELTILGRILIGLLTISAISSFLLLGMNIVKQYFIN